MKMKILLIIGAFMLMMPTTAKALSGTAGLSCSPTKINPGATSTCTLTFTTTENINGVHAKITVGSNLSLSSVSKNSHWQGDDNSATIDYYGDNIKGTVAIASFKIKAGTITTGATSSVTVSEIKFSDQNFNETSFGNKSVTITIPSTVNTLSSLSISGGSISFNSNTTTYNTTVNSSSTTITASATDPKAKVSGTGTKNLNYGKNTYKITVTAESGATKTYTLNITRPDNRSTNNNLASLSLSEGKISFKESTTSYNTNVAKTVNSVKINATLKDSKASFASGYGPRTINLKPGNNTAQIKVKAENGNVKTYTININKESDKDTNNNLKTLTLSDGTITFNKNTLSYDVTLPYDKEETTIKATAESTKAKVSGIGTKKLQEGKNTFKVVVTPEEGSSKTYTVNITRSEKNKALDTNNNLYSLIITGHDIVFDKNVTTYTVELKNNEALLDINAKAESTKANVVIQGNESLNNNDRIQVVVTAEDGSTKTYYITVTKKDNIKQDQKKEDNNSLFVPIVIFGGGAAIFLIAIIYRKIKLRK